MWLCPCNHGPLRRLGADNDGGYIVPDACLVADAVISLGVDRDWSFEMAWNQCNDQAVIHSYDYFDPTDAGNVDLLHDISGFFDRSRRVFYNSRVGPKYVDPDNTEFDIVLHRIPQRSIFLKMDIEGGEYNLIDSICDHNHRIVGLVAEFHGVGTTSHHCFLEAIPKLQTCFDIVHVHGNNSGPLTSCTLPEYLEITFLRRDLCVDKTPRRDFYLRDLDRANDANAPDYEMYFDHG